MNILMLLSKDYLTDPRVTKEATSLTNAGHHVTVIMWDRHKSREPDSTVNGVRILTIPTKGFMRLLPNDILRNPFWWRKAYKKAQQLYQTFHFDVVHCHDLDTLQAGVWLKKKIGVTLVYDAHEIFSLMIENNVPRFVVRYAESMEKRLVTTVDHIITVNEKCAEYFHTISTQSITIVQNCKDLLGAYQPPTQKIFTLTFIGTVNRSRFFPEMLPVVGRIQHVQLIIIAKKEDAIYDDVKRIAATFCNIQFLDPIPTSQVIDVTRQAHAVIGLFDPSSKINCIGSPNKLFEAMATGRPIIVTKGTNGGDIVEKEQCGLAVDYSEQGLEQAIITLRDNPALCEKLGRNGIRAAEREYNWGVQQKNLFHVYDRIQKSLS